MPKLLPLLPVLFLAATAATADVRVIAKNSGALIIVPIDNSSNLVEIRGVDDGSNRAAVYVNGEFRLTTPKALRWARISLAKGDNRVIAANLYSPNDKIRIRANHVAARHIVSRHLDIGGDIIYARENTQSVEFAVTGREVDLCYNDYGRRAKLTGTNGPYSDSWDIKGLRSSSNGDILWNFRKGNDYMQMTSSRARKLTVNGGPGDDTFSLGYQTDVLGHFAYNGGSGYDIYADGGSSIYATSTMRNVEESYGDDLVDIERCAGYIYYEYLDVFPLLDAER